MDAFPIEQVVIFLAAPDPCLDGVFIGNPDTLPDMSFMITNVYNPTIQPFLPFTYSEPLCSAYPVYYEFDPSNDDSTIFDWSNPASMFFQTYTIDKTKIG